MQDMDGSKVLKRILIFIFAILWILLAIEPVNRGDWFLENLLLFVAIPLIYFLDKKYRFSNLSSAIIFVFALLHSIGAHYTYAEVPLFFHIRDLFGLERNHYDRVVHFLFGLLVSIPLIEVLLKAGHTRKMAYILTVLVLFSCSSFYELVEWWVTEILYPEMGIAFLGAQGDMWDAQKDMSLALLGTTLTTGLHYLRNRYKADKRKSVRGHEGL